MDLEDRDPESLTVFDLFAFLVGDDEAAKAREDYCEEVTEQLRNVAGWIGFDAFLGGGDAEDAESVDAAAQDPDRRQSFIAVGLVAEISASLISGALVLLRGGNEYGAAALMRQLIECEYLLRAFKINFADAARWYDTKNREWRDFTPSKLRKIGGFDQAEYSHHCEAGGHPHPSGRHLLELHGAMDRLLRVASGDQRHLDTTRALWLDFAFHCDRTWRALVEVLLAEHARFAKVREGAISEVAAIRRAWLKADEFAQDPTPVLELFSADPDMLLSDLVSEIEAAEHAEDS